MDYLQALEAHSLILNGVLMATIECRES